ncbi:MAG: Hsp20/alpha crystallin family protein [Deltaproteobacteria bacterium]|nr:Hsp20/alpha crystallin family protein [Deltaproteobacteria bacterium]
MLYGWLDFDRPWEAMDDFRRRMDRLFDDLDRETAPVREGTWPRGVLYDAGEHLVLQVAVPGLTKEEVQISGSQDVLTVSGERKMAAPEGHTTQRRERLPVRFCRSFAFPVKADVEHAEAGLKDGILTITVPKAPEVRPRSIAVQVS